jgi:hypothetical protein
MSGSYNARQLNYRVLNGNAVALLVGDQVIGFGQTSSQSIDFGSDNIFGIGSAKIGEVQQQRLVPTITLDRMALTAEGVSFFGESTPWASILANTQLDIHVISNAGVPVFTFVSCTCSSFSQSVPANAAVTQQTSFVSLDVLDSNGNSILNSNSAINLSAAAVGGVVNFLGL